MEEEEKMDKEKIINKTMSRSDLLSDEAKPVVQAINDLIHTLYSKDLYMSSWYGTLPRRGGVALSPDLIKRLIKRVSAGREIKAEGGTVLGKDVIKELIRRVLPRTGSEAGVGIANRGSDYEPLPGSADDGRIPWYLYWEIFWVMKNGPRVENNTRLLDAGGASSLFTCYLASLGAEVYSIDINKTLVSNGNKIAKAMGWNMFSYAMNMRKLDFEDGYFDHAYSICVFEHLDYELKQSALSEIARCLRPNGILSVTFDYRNPAPAIAGFGPDTRERNQLKSKEDIERSFLSTGHFDLLGNQEFCDNGASHLVNPMFDNAPYTFGAIFLKKRS